MCSISDMTSSLVFKTDPEAVDLQTLASFPFFLRIRVEKKTNILEFIVIIENRTI